MCYNCQENMFTSDKAIIKLCLVAHTMKTDKSSC